MKHMNDFRESQKVSFVSMLNANTSPDNLRDPAEEKAEGLPA